MKKRLALSLLLILSGCDVMPKDAAGTLDHIGKSRSIRVGLIAMPGGSDIANALVQRLEQQTGARAIVVQGASEPLLTDLEQGRLDLVIGPFAGSSPWETLVSFGPPLSARGKGDARIETKAAMRNGENRWVMMVEHISRQIAPKDATQ